ncbi:hypothetical protein [Aquipluma nitroreducens]|nr:hypothetical protein [Aquipluma nitroreducens]
MKKKLTKQDVILSELTFEILFLLEFDNKYYDHIYYTNSAKPSDIRDYYIRNISIMSLRSMEYCENELEKNNYVENIESKTYLRIFDVYANYIAEYSTEEDYQVYVKLLAALKYKN